VMLLQGRGLRVDEDKAVDYMRAAAEKGVVGAQNRLGHLYAEGIGVKADPIEAAKWRYIARSAGLPDDKLDHFVAALPEAERSKAEAAATAWAEQKEVNPMAR